MESRMTATDGGIWGGKVLIKKEKELMGMDDSVVIAGRRGYKEIKW